MKIAELNLIAFGPFTNKRLDLSAGQQGLHLIYGPNEAGKSSSLRALTDWLYKMPPTFGDDFRHPKGSIRIGGRLLHSDGRELSFVRRKGRVKTLRCENDKELVDDELLESFLGKIDRDLFASMFGIDHHRLRSGGEDLASGKGKIGETLFAAGAGLLDLQRVQNSLQSEADQLLTASRRSGEIYKTLKAYKELRAEVKAAQLTVETWQSHADALQKLQQRKSELDEQKSKIDSELSRLTRFSNAAPGINRWRLKCARLAEVSSTPLLPPDFAEQVRQLSQNLQSAGLLETDAEESVKSVKAELESLAVDEPLLRQSDAIEALRDRFGRYRSSLTERTELIVKREAFANDVMAILRDLGREGESEAAEDLRLPRDKIVRIQDLGGQHAGMLERLQSESKICSKLNREIEAAEKKLADAGVCESVENIRSVLRDAQLQGDIESQLSQAERELERLQSASELAIRQLPLFKGKLAELESLAAPLPAEIDAFDDRLNDRDNMVQNLNKRSGEQSKRLETLDSRLRKLESGQPVPTQAELDHARNLREQGWQLVLSQWGRELQDEAAVADFLSQLPGATSLADGYQHCVAQSDRLADLLRIDAERVAVKANLESEIEDAQQSIQQLAAEWQAAEADAKVTLGQWQQLWSPLGIDARLPNAMQEWLRKRDSILQLAREIREQAEEQNRLVVLNDQWIGKIGKALQAAQCPTAETDLSLNDLIQQLVSAVDRLQASANRRDNLETSLEASRADLATADSDLKQTQSQLDQMQADWSAEMAVLGLDQKAVPAEANSRLSSIAELSDAFRDAERVRLQIDAIDREVEHFETDLQQILIECSTHLSAQPAQQAFATLLDQLQATRSASEQRKLLLEREVDLTKKIKVAQRQAKLADEGLQKLVEQAKVAAASDLLDAAEQSNLRRTLNVEVREAENELVQYSAGGSLDDFAKQVTSESGDENPLHPRIEQLKSDLADLNEERDNVIAEVTSARIALSQFNGNDQAALKNEQCESLAARLEEQLRSLAVLKMSSAALATAVERHREKNQGPLLGRASEIFREITLGHFSGLQADYDDKGDPVLAGIRGVPLAMEDPGKTGKSKSKKGQRDLFDPIELGNGLSGERVLVEGMSDGTCDQLYLALRLASLESWLDGPHEPLPFIVDDVLMNFDDARSAATLKVLAALSRRTQVIFFTHHQHLVDLAKQTLSRKDLFVLNLTS